MNWAGKLIVATGAAFKAGLYAHKRAQAIGEAGKIAWDKVWHP